MPVKIFCSYAHEDEPLLKKLKSHLFPLQRKGLVDVWYDREISAGSDWEKQIKEQLNTAHVILLMVSPDFMASDYCYGIEMQQAIERHERGEAHVIPIILRPVYWQDVLGKLQALPTDAIPVVSSGWLYQDEAFYNVTEGIRKVAMKVISSLPPSSPTLPIEASKPKSTETHETVQQQQTRKSDLLVMPGDFSWYCIRTLKGHKDAVLSVSISADGQTLASGSADNTIKLWNVKTGNLLHTLTRHESPVLSVAISADGQILASGSADNTIKLWNVKTGGFLRTLSKFESPVLSVAISADGQILARGSYYKTIKLWNVKTGDLLHTLSGHQNFVLSVSMSADGQILASSSVDNTLLLWNVKTGDLLHTLSWYESPVLSVAISADGQTLASGSADNTIKLWNVKTGDLLHTLSGHQSLRF